MIDKNTFFYNFLKLIPEWKVMTYNSLSKIFWIHPRVVWHLLRKNTNQDLFPCFKVVKSDYTLWWYNLWTIEKKNRLIKSWVKIVNWKIDKWSVWNWKVTNCFFWIPLELWEQRKLGKYINSLESFFSDSKLFSFQNPLTAHVTILFLWNISLENLHSIITTLNSKINNLWLSNFSCLLDKLWNFDHKVYYICTDKLKEVNNIHNIYDKVVDNLNFQLKRESFVHHLTLFRIKKDYTQQITIDDLSNLSCNIILNKIRFYITFDNVKQIPIADIVV